MQGRVELQQSMGKIKILNKSWFTVIAKLLYR